jgi:hypothetical protein
MKSIAEQIATMRDIWSDEFDLVEHTGVSARWVGLLKPNRTRYKVQIRYQAPLIIQIPDPYRFQPRVQVLDPVLQRHPKTNASIPHVYRDDDNPTTPYLCLFDPRAEEWSPFDLIATTTVPWTVLHLHYYEGWLLTGKWLGPERHPRKTDAESADKRATPIRGNATEFTTAATLARLETIQNSQH